MLLDALALRGPSLEARTYDPTRVGGKRCGGGTRVDYVLILRNQPGFQNRKAPENINVFRGFLGCGGSQPPRPTFDRDSGLIRSNLLI